MSRRAASLPLCRPSITEEDIRLVSETLRSGWIAQGPRTEEFERAFASRCGAPHAVAVSSGTAGLHLLLAALEIGPGDEVLTPSLTFASTVNQIVFRGAAPVFVDCEERTLNLSVDDAAAKAGPRCRAIIPVHMAGVPCDLDRLAALAADRGLTVIEDAAHAAGSSYRGRPIGSDGHPAVFSFHAIKNLTTGEGGMITVHDDRLAERLRRLRFHGIDRDAWKRYAGGTPSAAYDIREPGYKYTFTDIQAALGLGQLARLDRINEARRRLVDRYRGRLGGLPGIELPAAPEYPHVSSAHLFIVRSTSLPRDALADRLAARHVGTGIHFPPCHGLAYVRERFGASISPLPVTERVGAQVLSLPLFPDMTGKDVDGVADAVADVLKA